MFETDSIGQTPSSLERYLVISMRTWGLFLAVFDNLY